MAIKLVVFGLLILKLISGNNTPLIGILTLPCNSEPSNCPSEYFKDGVTYLPSSYVKWVQSGGARVIPILSDSSYDDIAALLPQLNGVLFTGGGTSFNLSTSFWYNNANNILNLLRKFHDDSDGKESIPLWTTCLGFEAMICLTAENSKARMHVSAEDISRPLIFSENGKTSRIFNSTMDYEYESMVYNYLETYNLTYNHHGYGFNLSIFNTNEYLKNNFTILSTSYDINNIEFVSLIESNDNNGLYWYGSQFHPEKPSYIFDYNNGKNNINHDIKSIISNEYFAQFFINECKLRNNNIMSQDKYQQNVIYNYSPYFIYDGTHSYEQVYIFPKSK